MLLMWIGEQITQNGIGNGISLIIFAGIVSAIPSSIGQMITMVNPETSSGNGFRYWPAKGKRQL